ncbi:MAG: UDP-N-acetylmuramate--L-alanine ligase [Candidatus Nanopelagicaceae bacterium]|nr:UDP-N-acetylmuramate--L-alanine ligase [Candidatus Nanopelagicaceae bacterium]
MSAQIIRDWSRAQVHFVGIGGSGMSGIARIMASRGAQVSGSDLNDSSTLNGLRSLGAEIYIGHSLDNLGSPDLVIKSSAIPANNPELEEAHKKGITVLERAAALAELMIGTRSVAVAGTHGKTTTTSMLTVALQHVGLDPSFAIGATVSNSGTNAHQGSGNTFIVEADESDGSFTAYKPLGAIITNIELDHVDNFATLAQIDQIFDDFAATIRAEGFLVICSDDPGALRLMARVKEKNLPISIATYGIDSQADLRLDRIHLQPKSAEARVSYKGRVLAVMELAITGRHNLLNAAAALLAGLELGANANDLIKGLSLFSGARRRFEIKGISKGITVIDDYGHHPTEVKATLESAGIYAQGGRVITVFQPHRYSRTQVFASEFAKALSASDYTYLLEIYPASEREIAGVSSLLISKEMDSAIHSYQPSMPEVIESVAKMAKSGDVILTLGAGDVSSLGKLILEAIES